MGSAGISFHLSHKEHNPAIKPAQQQPSLHIEPALVPSHHSVLVLQESPGTVSTWGAAFWAFCTDNSLNPAPPRGTAQPDPALAELSCSQDTSRCAGLQTGGFGDRGCEHPHLGALAAAPVPRAQAAPPLLTLLAQGFMLEPLQGWTLCLGCSSTTHIVLEMIHHVHVATRRVWQGKAESICTFLPEKHEPPLSLTAEQQ